LRRLRERSVDFVRVHTAKIEEIKADFALVEKSELYIKETDLSRWDVVQWLQPRGEHINYKGFQVQPMEVESLLVEHPYVWDAVVIGVYDKEQATEVPRAYIVLAPGVDWSRKTEEEIVAWLNDRIANYKRLRGGVRLVDTIPKTASGKVLRRLLKAMAFEEKNAEAVARNRAKL
jgi:acyl-CoA synthetase (AMP-forming)/AMP-acid ligase II